MAALWWMLGEMGVSMPDANIVVASASSTLWLVAGFVIDASWFALLASNLVSIVAMFFFPDWHFEIYGALAGTGSLLVPTLKRRRTDSKKADSMPPESGV